MQDQIELKTRIKQYLKDNGLNYSWLADRLGISRNTLNNYMAKKPIPENKLDAFDAILNGEEPIITDAPTEEPQPLATDDLSDNSEEQTSSTVKRRKRRTRQEIREDEEREKQEAQAAGGYIDEEAEDKKWREYGERVQREYFEQIAQERLERRCMNGFDMTSPEDAKCQCEGSVYNIIVPTNILKIYKREADFLNKTQFAKSTTKVTVAMLIARAITREAHDIVNYDNEQMEKAVEAFKRDSKN